MRRLFAAIVLCIVVSPAGCGQRGPLTLPSRGGEDTAATEPGESAGESDEVGDDDEDRQER